MMIDRTKYLSTDEARALRRSAEAEALLDRLHGRRRGPLTWALVDLATTTGLRIGELAALTVQDVDAKRRVLTVRRLKKRQANIDRLPITAELAAHLTDYIGDRTGPLLCGPHGRYSTRALAYIWNGALARAGLQHYGTRAARHTVAMELLAGSNGNIRLVQHQLGHADPRVTAATYADVTWDTLAAAQVALRAQLDKRD